MRPIYLIALALLLLLLILASNAHADDCAGTTNDCTVALGHVSGNVVGVASMNGLGHILYGLSQCGPDTDPFTCPDTPDSQTADTMVMVNATWLFDATGSLEITGGTLLTYADFVSQYGIAGLNAINQQGGTF